MKWKCQNCMCGPCVYESYNCREYDDINPKIEKCPRGMFAAIWLMSEEEPEQKEEKWWGDWIKPGNYIYVDATKNIATCNGIFRIVGAQNGMWLDLEQQFTKERFFSGRNW